MQGEGRRSKTVIPRRLVVEEYRTLTELSVDIDETTRCNLSNHKYGKGVRKIEYNSDRGSAG